MVKQGLFLPLWARFRKQDSEHPNRADLWWRHWVESVDLAVYWHPVHSARYWNCVQHTSDRKKRRHFEDRISSFPGKMPRNCVVGNCYNTSDNHNISFFRFPKGSKQRKLWVKFVKFRRQDFSGVSHSTHARICSAHFEKSAFERNCQLNFGDNCGPKFKTRLRKDAVPTIQSITCQETPTTSRRRPLSEVRLRTKVSNFTCYINHACLLCWWALEMKQIGSRSSNDSQ